MEPCTLLLLAVASSVMALVGIKRLAPAEERDGKRRRADRSEPAGFFGERLVQAMQGRVNGTRLEKLKALLARGPVLVAASVVRKALVTLRQQLVKIQKDTPSLKDRPVSQEGGAPECCYRVRQIGSGDPRARSRALRMRRCPRSTP